MRLYCLLFTVFVLASCGIPTTAGSGDRATDRIVPDTAAILSAAGEYLERDIVTVTDFVAERSAGGPHDYYSEGRYWWPDADNPDGPYIRRDGIANPHNFSGHKNALRDLSEMVTALTAAYEITGEEKYALRAIEHVKAWFVSPETRMNPNLLYGQAIKGVSTGRGIGIIDTLRLINVALSVELLERDGLIGGEDLAAIKDWFGTYGDWLTTHPYGKDEQHNNNNHSTWWGAQVAAFARVADRPDLTEIARQQFRDQLPIQVATDGSLPDELGRTKPFHYANYTLRAWATYAELLSTREENYWDYTFTTTLAPYGSEEDRTAPATVSLRDAVDYLLPYFRQPATWPYRTELETEIHPRRNDFLVFASRGLQDDNYYQLWEKLEEEEEELHANLLLWKNQP